MSLRESGIALPPPPFMDCSFESTDDLYMYGEETLQLLGWNVFLKIMNLMSSNFCKLYNRSALLL